MLIHLSDARRISELAGICATKTAWSLRGLLSLRYAVVVIVS